MVKTIWTLLLTIGLFAAAGSADAGTLGRHLGLGWGDGYQARCDCRHGGCFGWLHHGRAYGYHHAHGCKGKCQGIAPGYAVEPGYIMQPENSIPPQVPPTYVPTPAVYPQ